MSVLGQFFMGRSEECYQVKLSPRHLTRPITAHRGLQDSQQGIKISKNGQTGELVSIHPFGQP